MGPIATAPLSAMAAPRFAPANTSAPNRSTSAPSPPAPITTLASAQAQPGARRRQRRPGAPPRRPLSAARRPHPRSVRPPAPRRHHSRRHAARTLTGQLTGQPSKPGRKLHGKRRSSSARRQGNGSAATSQARAARARRRSSRARPGSDRHAGNHQPGANYRRMAQRRQAVCATPRLTASNVQSVNVPGLFSRASIMMPPGSYS